MRNFLLLLLAISSLSIAYGQCVVTINATPASDSSLCNGQLTAVASGQAPFTYNWTCNNGTCIGYTGNTVSNACPGVIYTVTVADANGCVTSASVVVTYTNTNPCVGLSVVANPTNASSQNVCDGQVQANAFGGTLPYTYLISGNGYTITGGPLFDSLCVGNYQLSVTDALGCNAQNTFSLTGNNSPCSGFTGYISSVTFANDTNSCDGVIMSAVSGGTSPYSYSWSDGSTASNITSACSGFEYTVCITDMNGCQVCDSVIMGDSSLINCSDFNAAINSTNVTLSGLCDGTASITVNGGLSPYVYSWSSGHSTQSVIDLCEGSYIVSVMDANNCQLWLSFLIGSETGNVGDTIVLNSGIFIDSNVLDTVYSGWLDNCNFDFSTIVSATIDGYANLNDSTWVSWQLIFNDGTTTTLTVPYFLNTSLGGVYDVVLQLYCGLRSTPQWLMAYCQLDYEPNTSSLAELKTGILFFPNPTNNIITSNHKLSRIEIVNSIGQTVLVALDTDVIDLGVLKSGVYNAVISVDGEIIQRRLIKE